MSLSVTASQAYCIQVARRTGRNFYHAFRVLPRDQRVDMSTLYAFMRKTDDLADEGPDQQKRRQSLDDWKQQVDAAFDTGDTESDPCLPALVDMVRRRGVPREHLETVIAGCRSDLGGVTLETYDQLRSYCYQVAGVVGLCCLHIWGYDNSEAARHKAIDTGTAMQLTNILRDLREDTAASRFYLPTEDLVRFGVTAQQLRNGYQTDEYLKLMAFEAQRAEGLYERAEDLIPHVEKSGRKALVAMIKIYRGLLREIERRDFDVYSSRVSVPWYRKLGAVVGAALKR